MSLRKRSKNENTAADGARQVAAALKPAAARVRPLAKTTGAAAGRQVRKTRAWAAPRVERSGQVLQETIAPKVSAMLSSAAQRIDPSEHRVRHWRKPVGVATATAAASAATAFVRSRMKPNGQSSGPGPDADTTESVPADGLGNGQRKTRQETLT
ncbi:MAG TPA: hypothetical protein VNF47_04445 [Streptosporangiaceae bacterium]|nr:hypothetical protein [Streptosporangiaceae bacterium]